ncbi:MAG: (Fe-S)-binding protein [Deltaproteobacteria bacterium]|nr:(Fe-S)-binding protein [Deltaproteobacteria bacterium]
MKDDFIRKELERCVRCGNCMSVCPVYEVMGREGGVARGKVSLFRAHLDGLLDDDDPAYREILTSCLLCGRCKSACPNEVDTPAIVQAARARMARRGRLGRLKAFVLNWILPKPALIKRLAQMARIGRPFWAARVPKSSGLRVRFMRGPGGEQRQLPELAPRFYLDRDQEDKRAAEGAPRVALFVGCVHNMMRPEGAEAAVEVLRRAGAQVVVPREQACCGLPAWGAGHEEGARALARRNVDALWPAGESAPDFVTSPCASCAAMLNQHMAELLVEDTERALRAKELAARVIPFSILWTRLTGVEAEGPAREADPEACRVTYHDPCHLSRGFGEKDAPRFLLTHLSDVQFVDMSHPCRCCGHGGFFNLAHYDLSLRMADDKARRIMDTGAQVVATECSGCLIQLQEALARAGSTQEVLTTAEAALRYGLNIDKD